LVSRSPCLRVCLHHRITRYAPGYGPYGRVVTPLRVDPWNAAGGARIVTPPIPVCPRCHTPALAAPPPPGQSGRYPSPPRHVPAHRPGHGEHERPPDVALQGDEVAWVRLDGHGLRRRFRRGL